MQLKITLRIFAKIYNMDLINVEEQAMNIILLLLEKQIRVSGNYELCVILKIGCFFSIQRVIIVVLSTTLKFSLHVKIYGNYVSFNY